VYQELKRPIDSPGLNLTPGLGSIYSVIDQALIYFISRLKGTAFASSKIDFAALLRGIARWGALT
jgi:hypothetical protein